MTDLYTILSVSRSSSFEEITSSYRKLSKEFHPDRNPGDVEAESTYKTIQDAYEILSDPDRRDRYDQTGDTRSPQTEESQTEAILAGCYARVLSSILNDPEHPAPKNFNILTKMKDSLHSQLSMCRTQRATPERAIRILTEISGRFSDEPDNLFENLTREQLRHATDSLKGFDADIAKLQRAIDRLADFTYKWEEVAEKPNLSPFGLPSSFKWKKVDPALFDEMIRRNDEIQKDKNG